jgi:putative SOS response-associated peptidase YedK
MCGRFTLHTPPGVLQEHFGIDEVPAISASYNIAPSQDIAAVRVVAGRRGMALLRWGLVPSWAKDTRIGYRMINARAETVADKPAWRVAFRQRRCLIPADGFYEWRRTGEGKQPYHIRMQDRSVFAFAGLWERWQGADDAVIESCSIIVTAANETIQPVHDRMPVIVAPQDYTQWLDPDVRDTGKIKSCLRAWPAEEMEAYPVSTRVNRPVNNDAHCIDPLQGSAA